jgi:hypothetical protein
MIDALHSLKKNTAGRIGQSIAGKLYCFALLSIIAVVALAACAVYFAKTTETAAHRLYDHGFRGTLSAARLSLLLEQHRRLVESMLSEVDRERIDHGRHDLASTKIKLAELMEEIVGQRSDLPASALERRIAASLPALFEAAQKVVFYANDFAQDKASEQAEDYSSVANGIQILVRDYRDQRLHEAEEAVAFMLASAKSLTIAVLICAFAAFVLIGPIGLATMHRVLSRLGDVTGAMVKLSRHETATVVPYRYDRDEVGEMARAVEVF